MAFFTGSTLFFFITFCLRIAFMSTFAPASMYFMSRTMSKGPTARTCQPGTAAPPSTVAADKDAPMSKIAPVTTSMMYTCGRLK
eukprot:CAMPEP_0115085254 /NCGR_PEP_ID=MMETSP0227-20121206/21817_1 /TAXON_ID=89957 /ORGANISM="Polarella glacialis, Strain CCMP 1383" /LENGTH=83 /DNA_ID=CAMNT_0002474359 /DNA_START=577 /DNA_END=828 /DNA_ORIENTATION=+